MQTGDTELAGCVSLVNSFSGNFQDVDGALGMLPSWWSACLAQSQSLATTLDMVLHSRNPNTCELEAETSEV